MGQHTTDASTTFLGEPDPTPEVSRMYADDLASDGYVMNLTRVWAHLPSGQPLLSRLLEQAHAAGALGMRERGILVAATASTLGDAYCTLAWGGRLAGTASPEIAAAVVRGDDTGLDAAERALAAWARRLVRDPNATTAADVQELRDAGYDDRQILAITLYVAGRLAFSTVNDALGARPDHQLLDGLPPELRDAVDFGRPAAAGG